MKSISRLFFVLLLLSLPVVSCYDDTPAGSDPVQPRCVTLDDSKQLIYETASEIYASLPEDVKEGDTFTPLEGMTVTVVSLTDDPRSAVLDVSLDRCVFTMFKATVSGNVTININMGDPGFQMVFNTAEGEALDVTGAGLVDAAVEFNDLVVFVNTAVGSGFSGTVIINGTEYTLDEIITMEQALQILAEALGKVPWNDVADEIEKGSNSRVAVSLGNIYDQDGLKIDLALELNFTEPGAILTFTFDDFLLSDGAIADQTLSGDMQAFVTFESLTVLKIVVNTGSDPLYVNTGIFGIRIPLAFRDVTLYYDLLAMGLAEDPAPSGTIYLAGIPVGLDSVWFDFLLSLFQ